LVPSGVPRELRRVAKTMLAVLLLLHMPFAVGAEIMVTGARNLSIDVSAAHGRIALDLQGGIWALPEGGGQAELLADAPYRLTQPRWSPDGHRILYRADSRAGSGLWTLQVATRQSEPLIPAEPGLRDGVWHPDGDRVVFSARTCGRSTFQPGWNGGW
jgi:dipeptidyl aminopeptidase/acylaminoacyl peptidase